MDEQLRLDLDDPAGQRRRQQTRAAQRRLIEKLQIPTPPRNWRKHRPSAAVCKAVLLALDAHIGHGEAWRIYAKTLAAELQYKDRGTINRAVAWLTELGYISSQRTGRSSLFSIDRQQIAAAAAPPTDGGATLNRWGRNPRPMGAQPSTTLPPNTPTHHTTPTNQPPEEEEEKTSTDWQTVAALLCRHLTDWQTPLAAARQLVDPVYGLAVLTHYQAAAGLLGPGALHRRLTRSHPDLPPTAGWPQLPPPDQAEQRAARLLAICRRHMLQNNHQGRPPDAAELARLFKHSAARQQIPIPDTATRRALFRAGIYGARTHGQTETAESR